MSYQYSCRTISADGEAEEHSWSGIIFPEGGEDDDRLSLTDFVKQSISHGLSSIPELSLPSDIYLVAHFTRADVPGFSEFKDEALRGKMNLESVRSLFMNVGKSIGLDLPVTDGGKHHRIEVTLRDTMALAPNGATSLAQLGDILGFAKLQLSSDPEQELYYKEHMSEFLRDQPELFESYAIRDAEICALYTAKIIKLYHEKTGKFRLPVTLTSIGVDMIQNYWVSNRIDPLEIVGKEKITEKTWSKRYKRNVTRKRLVSKKKLHWSEDFFTECYHGGRNEQFWFGPGPEGVWYDYDLTSAYPSAMALIGIPDWSSIRPITSNSELLAAGEFRHNDLAFANVNFKFPESVKYPVLPVRTENGLIFPRQGNSTTHVSEILLAKELGCHIKLVEGRFISSKHGRDPLDPSALRSRVFEGFSRMCIEERRKYPKRTLDNLFWKELVNSTYGKTAQGLRERRIYNLRDAETKRLEPSKITNPVYAAFITAFCRGVLGEIMNGLPDHCSIFSVTTDGFLTNATDQEMMEAGGYLAGYYHAARSSLRSEEELRDLPARIYEVKHIIRQPLGWRTRGQATLKSSEQADWKGFEDEPKEDEMIVLAKGGIKLRRFLSKTEQNNEIVSLFLGRKPTDTLTVTLGAGIREMYEQGMDFVDNEMTKRLSMEFDWKRRPTQASDVAVDPGKGQHGSHLAFATEPWDTVDQFNKVRELWERYTKDDPKCLKTRPDYDDFAHYFEGMLAAEGSAQAWLRKSGGPLKRLRRDLIVAQKLRQAGTHQLKPQALGRTQIFPTKKLKAKELAEMLSDSFGVPCSKSDVDNARKIKVFKPYQVPRTEQTVRALKMIKKELFPYLVIDEFLTKSAEFNIAVRDL
ncbi:DNA polymerase [Fontisubflavum oceani]|uniref:DNA polymerase n=1 Tax=Fontisubflavum oceani TaxID=2978973 RepID=UPI0025B48B7F|nr:DNA polymerase [Fontisubflavum oceani]WJY20427.1 DNA polymerase [Fontisubflavum oceani]